MSNSNCTGSNRTAASVETCAAPQCSGTQRLHEAAGELKQNLHELGDAAREAAHEQIGKLRESATTFVEAKCAKCQEAEQSFENRIRKEPVKSTLIACGIGFVLGLVFRRR